MRDPPKSDSVTKVPKRVANSSIKFAGIRRGSLKKIARRSGVKRMSSLAFNVAMEQARAFTDEVLTNAMLFADNRRQITVRASDIVYALRRMNRSLYGFGI